MPNIADRDAKEEAVGTLLRRALDRHRAQLLQYLGNPPDIDNVPPSFWQLVEREVADDTRQALATVFLLGLVSLGDEVGPRPPPGLSGALAGGYAAVRSRRLAEGSVATFRERVSVASLETRAAIRAGRAPRTALRDLNSYIRETAELQGNFAGPTEVAAAHTAGELEYRDMVAELGVDLTAIWHSEPDACDICASLDQATEDVWGAEYPDGPPGPHPNCRCWLVFEPEQDWDDPYQQVEELLEALYEREQQQSRPAGNVAGRRPGVGSRANGALPV